MAISKAQQAAVKRYNDAHYDRIEVKVPAGEKEMFQKAAADNGESLSGFFYRAARELLEREGKVTSES